MRKLKLIQRREFIKRAAIGSSGLVAAKSVMAANLGKSLSRLAKRGPAKVTSAGDDSLAQGFRVPPAGARPYVWWHWMDRNVSKEGITADLEALQRIGLGGAQFFNIDYQIPTGPVEFLSPEWFDAIRHAAAEADRLGLEIGMHNCSGWSSSGGPWVTPDHAMQLVTTSEMRVKGPVHFNRKLEKPEVPEGKFPDYYHDIAVLACPTPAAEVAGNGYRLADWRTKAVETLPAHPWVWQYGAGEDVPSDTVYRRNQIIDISGSLKADGTLTWDVPEGDWTIIRIGYAPRPRMNTHPEVPAGRGLEVDKMSRGALDLHFEKFIAVVLKDMGRFKGNSFTNLLIDSYEVGPQNWTPRFREEFQRRRGYDLTLYLPALTGRVLDSAEVTERFLWDYRRTIADLFHDNYYSYFTELCHQRGLKAAYEPYYGPFSIMDNAMAADIPMTEFWTGHPFGTSAPRTRLVASGAHLEGKVVIGAESFTSGWGADRFVQHPYALKALGDFQFCDGVNRFYFHDFTHQPWVDAAMRPGMTMGPWGLHFARTVTWWEQAGAWMSYIHRCQYLLQSGRPVSDILCFSGEDAGVLGFWGKSGDLPPIPEGYDYEFVNAALLLAATVQDGYIVLPKGQKFRLLVLPNTRYLTLAVARKIAELVKGGGVVVGPAPECSPSLSDYPACDTTIRHIAAELWGNCDGQSVTEHGAGIGKVFWGKPLDEVLADIGIQPDFACRAKPAARICYKHRTSEAAEIYFISNQSANTVTMECKFRVSGKRPELWDAETGMMELAALYTESDGGITVPLQLGPSGSVFVVFRQPVTSDHGVSVTAPSPAANGARSYQLADKGDALILSAWAAGDYVIKTSKGRKLQAKVPSLPAPQELDAGWEVSFPPNLGAPASVQLVKLMSLTQHPDAGVRYFSGTASYANHFNVTPGMLTPRRDIYLDLGIVNYLAELKINGTPFGILWKPPYHVCITPVLRSGRNRIEVHVTNVWANRLIGDEKLPDDCEWIKITNQNRGWRLREWPKWYVQKEPRPSQRIAFATWRYYDGTEEPPASGLIGPVKLHTIEKIQLT